LKKTYSECHNNKQTTSLTSKQTTLPLLMSTTQQQIAEPFTISHKIETCVGGHRLVITISGCNRRCLGPFLKSLPAIQKKVGRVSPIAYDEPRENLSNRFAKGTFTVLSTNEESLETVANVITKELKDADAQQILNDAQRRIIQENQKAAWEEREQRREQKRAEWEQQQKEKEQQKKERSALGNVAKITTVARGRKFQVNPTDFPSIVGSSAVSAPAVAVPAEQTMTTNNKTAWD